MIKLIDFLELAMDDFYKINIYDITNGEEVVHQKEVGEVKEMDDLLYKDILSWDICEENNNELCINIEL